MSHEGLEKWRRAEILFSAALERSPEDQSTFLAEACAGDRELRSLVEELLALDQGAAHFLPEQTPKPSRLTHCSESAPSPELQRLGPYQLLRPIGDGGMGTVFEAVRKTDDVEQRVAVKLLGSNSQNQAVSARERQILARFTHPHIARFLDTGETPEGQPYVVMEYVDGLPISDFCDIRRLQIRDRIRLFSKVCSAVEYAHRNLVVHRDLKPANILITDESQPKLLDFGISKLLDPLDPDGKTPDDLTSRQYFTPAYASPEQIRQELVTTASDIYSLGVLLFELLVGVRPFDLQKSVNLQSSRNGSISPSNIVHHETFDTPSSVRADLRGTTPGRLRRLCRPELDAVVRRCLEVRPEGRYRSVGDLVDDLDRYLRGFPVKACQQSFWYQGSRFLQRHAMAMSLFAIASVALVGWTITSLSQAATVRKERDRATRASDEAEAVTRFLTEAFAEADPHEASLRQEEKISQDTTIGQVLEASARRLTGEFEDQPLLRARLMSTVASIQIELGQYESSQTLLEEALSIQRRVSGTKSIEAGRTLLAFGHLQRTRSLFPQAEEALSEALAIARLGGPGADEMLARGSMLLGELHSTKRDYSLAEELLRQSLAQYRRLDRNSEREILNLLAVLGQMERRRGRFEEAEVLVAEAMALREQSASPDLPLFIPVLQEHTGILEAKGNGAGAVAQQREVVRLCRKNFGEEHPTTHATLGVLGGLLAANGELEEAEDLLREALENVIEVQGENGLEAAVFLNNLALILRDQGKLVEAAAMLRQAAQRSEAMWDSPHPEIAIPLYQLSLILQRLQDLPQANIEIRRALAVLDAMEEPPLFLRAVLLTARAGILNDLGRYSLALPIAQESMTILEEAQRQDPMRIAILQTELAGSLIGLGRLDEARPLSQKAMAGLEASPQTPPWYLERARSLVPRLDEVSSKAVEITSISLP